MSRSPPNSRMLEIAISLIVGFALGYGVREWAFRQDRSQQGVDALSEINTTLLCAVLRLLGKGNELWDGSDSRDCLHTY
jgi:hypothetical protein